MSPRALARLLGPLRRSINLMVGRAVVSLVNDALKMQGVQVALLADEVRDNVERFQEYGFTSHPKPGAEAVVVAVGGSRNQLVVIACDDRRYRLAGLAEGEVALYTDEGDKIVLKRGNVIEVTAATKVQLTTPLLEVAGDIEATGHIHAAGEILDLSGTNARTVSGMRDQYNLHTHGGVQPGAGNTGAANPGM